MDEHTPEGRLEALLERVAAGETVALVTDAGTPGLSDPGALLTDLAYERGLRVDAVPGPSAVANALALSGFFAQRFLFLGYLPRRAGAIKKELAPYGDSPLTIVLFEAPSRVQKTLFAAHEALGDRRAALCREMTKLHQEVVRGRLSELAGRDLVLKGEITLVIEGLRRGD